MWKSIKITKLAGNYEKQLIFGGDTADWECLLFMAIAYSGNQDSNNTKVVAPGLDSNSRWFSLL